MCHDFRIPRGRPAARPSVWRKLRWFLWRAAAVLGAFLFLILVTVALAGWYTSRPQFCNSCHIMGPYYRSWQTSAHKNVSCIECHFAPSFGGEIRGKMLGLVQLAKYVTQTQGPRPIAEVPDASCLRSGCHETRLLSGRVPGDFHGIPFDHTPHLGESRRGKRLRCTSCHGQIVQGSTSRSPRRPASSVTSRTSRSTRSWEPAPAATRSRRSPTTWAAASSSRTSWPTRKASIAPIVMATWSAATARCPASGAWFATTARAT